MVEPIHLKGATSEDIGEVVLLAGDPGRIKMIGNNFADAKVVTDNREYLLITGYWNGRKVSACSTGIGISSTEIAIIELIELGAEYLVRIGGCGAWDQNIHPGDIIINHAVARDAGTLASYGADTLPAVADPILVNHLRNNLISNDFKVHLGLGLTTQSYYLGQDRNPDYKQGPVHSNNMKYWCDRSVINCDMETAAIYILSLIYGVCAANCLVVHGNRITDEWLPDDAYDKTHNTVFESVLESCFNVIDENIK